MKKLTLIIGLMGLLMVSQAQTEVKGKIEKVTVYPTSALVEKSITTSLQRGENKFIITGNATCVGTNDVHFSASGDWFISAMRCESTSMPAKESLARLLPQTAYNQYLQLQGQLDEVALKISNANILVNTLNQQAGALSNLKAIRNTMAFDTIVNLKAQFEYQRKESQEINTVRKKAQQEIAALTSKERQLNREMDELLRKYTGGRNVSDRQNDIYVTIYSNKNVPNAKICYSYKTPKVGCAYSYDVMLDEDKHQGVFLLKVQVSQNTGEHWNNCPVVFSTTEAGYAGFDSELPTYYLDYVQPQSFVASSQLKGARYAKSMVANTLVAAADSYPEEEDMVSELAIVEDPIDMVTSSNLTLTREFALQTPQTISSGELPQTLMLHTDTTATIFARYCTPKNEQKVHFTALLPDWELLGLLETSCDVYLNNRYVSMSNIVTEGTGDTMRFAVGQDRNVLVNRKFVKSSPDKNGVLAKEITETATITITLKNTKQEEISVNVKDQIPISNASDLKVTDVKADGGMVDAKTGVVRWQLNLNPLEQKAVTLSYTVRYPKEKEHMVILR